MIITWLTRVGGRESSVPACQCIIIKDCKRRVILFFFFSPKSTLRLSHNIWQSKLMIPGIFHLDKDFVKQNSKITGLIASECLHSPNKCK